MSGSRDRQAYSLIWRLGQVSLKQTLRMIAELLQRRAHAPSATEGAGRKRRVSAEEYALEQHSAVRQYRRLVWLGWHIDYEKTPQVYVPGAQVVMKRGKRFRVIVVDGGREV